MGTTPLSVEPVTGLAAARPLRHRRDHTTNTLSRRTPPTRRLERKEKLRAHPKRLLLRLVEVLDELGHVGGRVAETWGEPGLTPVFFRANTPSTRLHTCSEAQKHGVLASS